MNGNALWFPHGCVGGCRKVDEYPVEHRREEACNGDVIALVKDIVKDEINQSIAMGSCLRVMNCGGAPWPWILYVLSKEGFSRLEFETTHIRIQQCHLNTYYDICEKQSLSERIDTSQKPFERHGGGYCWFN